MDLALIVAYEIFTKCTNVIGFNHQRTIAYG